MNKRLPHSPLETTLESSSKQFFLIIGLYSSKAIYFNILFKNCLLQIHKMQIPTSCINVWTKALQKLDWLVLGLNMAYNLPPNEVKCQWLQMKTMEGSNEVKSFFQGGDTSIRCSKLLVVLFRGMLFRIETTVLNIFYFLLLHSTQSYFGNDCF